MCGISVADRYCCRPSSEWQVGMAEGVDRPHSVRRSAGDPYYGGGSTFYYGTDEIGNVTGLFDGAGNVVNRYRYTPFGGTSWCRRAHCRPRCSTLPGSGTARSTCST